MSDPVTTDVTETGRLQLALNVRDVDEAVAFYSRMFGVEPHKVRPGYANFEVAQPPLKLVLIENPRGAGPLNHLGVEVFSTDDVHAATRRFGEQGLATQLEDGVDCCHATQDKVWVDAPDGLRWEVYTITDDQLTLTPVGVSAASTACCADDTSGAGACC
jgi:catechol 2,3-dioxygenase-like lactoylglutathione lyase family enzyme